MGECDPHARNPRPAATNRETTLVGEFTMRLTLRTLLAYLDDTLDPAETKLIGQKVAESAAAQELIERIKKVTRRRSLANPAVFGDESKLDPNTVAGYLSDVLSPEEVSEVEQTCLEHDMYLAEVAACHQILTLMLSEPVRVPPTARQRMYRLVKGRESIPYRKPPAFKPVVESGDKYLESEVKESKPPRWPAYVAGILALSVGLVFAVWLAWPEHHAPIPRIAGDPLVVIAVPNPVTSASKTDKPMENQTKLEPPKEPAKEPPKEPAKEPPKEPAKEPPKPTIGKVAESKPSKDKREIGRMISPGAVLIQKENGGRGPWPRVAIDARVSTGIDLIAMPGSRADIRMDNGLMLSLWGNLPELVDVPVLESAATLHSPPEGLEADLTLDRGRLVLTNPRAKPAMARVRFAGETWDLWLSEQSEVLLDLLRSYPGTVPFSKQPGGEGPLTEMYLGVVKGRADVLRKDLPSLQGSAPALIYWNNKKGEVRGPTQLKDLLPSWTPLPPNRPEAVQARAALEEFAKRVSPKEADVEVVLTELQNDSKPAMQAL